MAEDRRYEAMMSRALRLAAKGAGWTSPNPMVGAVVFNRDGVIATGYHRYPGGAHAEVAALSKAGERARGASLAVNLEPCCHVGRTGPCTEAIIRAGIREVVFAIEDPNPQVRGHGARRLRNHNIKVVIGVLADRARRLNEVYLHYINTGRPFVILKLAQTLDGQIATATGDSQWITGDGARRFAHQLRARCDAIAVGAATVRHDNPRLTVRLLKGRDPYRIILTASGALPPNCRALSENQDGRTIIATARRHARRLAATQAQVWSVKSSPRGLDLVDLLTKAAKREISSLLFEGGAAVATSLLTHKLVDKIYLLISPRLLGRGTPGIGDLKIRSLEKAITFREGGFEDMKPDILFWGYPEK